MHQVNVFKEGTMGNTIDLHDLFFDLQQQLIAKLVTNRKNIKHSGIKGDATELCWLDMLNSYLPQRYHAAKSFVLDSEGLLSDQIDIVIFDRQYSPFLFNQDDALYVPAESVYAAIEVKQDIDKDMIEYAGDKTASVRRLKRTSAPITHAGGKFPPKEHFEILSGIIALECKWSPPFGDSFTNAIKELSLEKRIDLGCALRSGAFDVTYLGDTESIIETCGAEESLIFFFLHLLTRLQQLGTVPAMNIAEYAKSLCGPK
jgi:hypothetical protein